MNDIQSVLSVSAVDGTDDREARSKFWIAVYTKPRCEKKASVDLIKRGIKTYVPIQQQLRQWSDRKKMIDVVVIPMIIFVFIDEVDITTVKRHPLIHHICSMPGHKVASIIPNEQICRLQFILGQSDIPVEFETGLLSVQDNVRIARGKLCGVCGEILNINEGKAQVVVKIDGLGGAKLTVNKQDLEKV